MDFYKLNISDDNWNISESVNDLHGIEKTLRHKIITIIIILYKGG